MHRSDSAGKPWGAAAQPAPVLFSRDLGSRLQRTLLGPGEVKLPEGTCQKRPAPVSLAERVPAWPASRPGRERHACQIDLALFRDTIENAYVPAPRRDAAGDFGKNAFTFRADALVYRIVKKLGKALSRRFDMNLKMAEWQNGRTATILMINTLLGVKHARIYRISKILLPSYFNDFIPCHSKKFGNSC